MAMKYRFLFVSFCMLLAISGFAQKQYSLSSPDGKLKVTIGGGEALTWSIQHEETIVLQPSAIALNAINAKSNKKVGVWEGQIKVTNVARKSVNSSFATPFYKKAEVKDVYNQLSLTLKGGFVLEFRAYDEGAAYRIVSRQSKPYLVMKETVEFNFAGDYKAFVPYVNDNRSGERYCYSFESYYDEAPLSAMFADSLAITPLLVDLGNGKKATLMEAGLENYPGMFLKKGEGSALVAEFAPVPLTEVIGGHAELNLIPTERAGYIAEINQPRRSFPWRVVLVTTSDLQLADNDMAQRLAPACKIADTSWIKPGKVAWDWWNTCNLTGVDFKSGMNTPTYKAYIDFAAQYNLEYIIIDEGWSGKESLLEGLNPNIDLKEIIAHANAKGVGVILWASWRNSIKHLEASFKHYAEMGVKGFKVDFFDRDDQPLIASVEQIAECAVRNKLLLDLHGLKPYGIQRAYPNIVNFEGVKGLENAKWEPIVNGAPLHDFPRYDVTAPYLRQLVGPMDYTPGATKNAIRGNFRAINDQPMSQGTRVHQMAMYTLFEAPLQMLADSPSYYQKEPEYTAFIAQVPTVLDETIALNGEIGEHIAIARRKGSTWYVAAMTNWTPRQYAIDFSFLSEGNYQAEIFADGVNADKDATDYHRQVKTITKKDKLSFYLAPGGGWTAILKLAD